MTSKTSIAAFLALLLSISGAACAIPIVSVTGSGQPTGFAIGTGNSGEQILGISWTATESYTNVAITALLSASGGSGAGAFRGLAHLTTTAGPGTTSAAQVTVSQFNVTLAPADRDYVQLFSGLTLGPGGYFLILEALPGSLGNWWTEPTQVITLDTGVVLNSSIGSANSAIDQTFAPASSFVVYNNGFPWSFIVTGDRVQAVPEPPGMTLLLAAMIGALAGVRRRSLRRLPFAEVVKERTKR
jgi:hypothetical protein